MDRCPYCDAPVTITHEDGCEDGSVHTHTCHDCDRTFLYTIQVWVSHNICRADCLNEGGAHTYQKTRTYPPEHARWRCTQCGDERALSADDGSA